MLGRYIDELLRPEPLSDRLSELWGEIYGRTLAPNRAASGEWLQATPRKVSSAISELTQVVRSNLKTAEIKFFLENLISSWTESRNRAFS